MEFCDFGDLEDYCRQFIPALDRRVDLLSQATAGLLFLHSSSITHRDIKLRNILVTIEKGCVIAKLSDLGCARHVEMSMMKTLCGTQTFWAPEQLPQAGDVRYKKEVDMSSGPCLPSHDYIHTRKHAVWTQNW